LTAARPLIRPFTALRPRPEHAAAVAAPPYDVLSSEEARVRAAGKPYSFLHISKAEIDLPDDVDHYAPEVYAKSAQNLKNLIDEGILRRDTRIDFVGGICGLPELERRVNSGEMAVAFAMHPTQLTELMSVADAGEVMPLKSCR